MPSQNQEVRPEMVSGTFFREVHKGMGVAGGLKRSITRGLIARKRLLPGKRPG